MHQIQLNHRQSSWFFGCCITWLGTLFSFDATHKICMLSNLSFFCAVIFDARACFPHHQQFISYFIVPMCVCTDTRNWINLEHWAKYLLASKPKLSIINSFHQRLNIYVFAWISNEFTCGFVFFKSHKVCCFPQRNRKKNETRTIWNHCKYLIRNFE